MKKLMYIISIILCFGALVVTNNKINKLENQIVIIIHIINLIF